jgi:starch synthase (maltosyl-transferring)
LREVLIELAENLMSGTENGIRVDSESGLVFSPSHFTWMDTNFPAGTPRQGYPIEIQALWFAALDFLAEIDPENDGWRREADRVQESIRRLFRLGNGQGLSDCLHADPDTPASAAVADDALRPNQLLAVTLGAVADKKLAEEVLRACRELLIPGAIRSLADRPVHPPLIVERDGHVLNDPSNPYWGVYAGDEDTRRKPAYHNGTAWTWPFPSYAEALCAVHGDAARAVALDLLATSLEMLNAECIGQICEVLDADAPHAQRGCGAQAWGVTELYRVFTLL